MRDLLQSSADGGAEHLSGAAVAGLAVATVAVVAIAGVMSGLTLGLLSLDRLDLEVMLRTGALPADITAHSPQQATSAFSACHGHGLHTAGAALDVIKPGYTVSSFKHSVTGSRGNQCLYLLGAR